MKQLFKINGKYYDKLEDIPEEIRKLIDKDENGVADIIEENPNLDSTKPKREIILQRKTHNPTSSPQSPTSADQGGHRRKILLILVGIAIGLAYILPKFFFS